MTNVQSVVTPATNGNAHGSWTEPKAPKGKGKTKALASTAIPATVMTAAQACEIAFNYGENLAGLDGGLTKALQTFKDDETVQADMLANLNIGYMMKKLGYTKDQALDAVGRLNYNEKKQDDHHRTFEQQRVMDTVRVLWHRAKKNAGIVKKTEKQAEAEATRAEKEAEKAEHEARLIKADEIVNPKDDVDPFDALARLVLTMKALQSKHAKKLTGDRGSAWRNWLANAPK